MVASSSYFVGMRTVGLKVLKNRLAEYVRIAAAGERVLISDRDRVVAELVPPDVGRAEQVSDAVLASLVTKGLLSPPLVAGRPLTAVAPRTTRLSDLLSELDSDRGER
jgi:antitoxin (DNA-binding transcriptional repressor) of toxin-antitoxin stability system